MARAIYEIKLKERLFPASTATEAVEMWDNGSIKGLDPEDVEINIICKEEDTMKLFLLAKTMYDTEKFELNEIQAAVRALACKLGHFVTCEPVTECILKWCERTDFLSLPEMEEWLIG